MSDTQTNLKLEHTDKLQIVVVVRYKPSAKSMDAGSMVDSVASGVKGATDAVDNALSFIPGVLEEQKNKEAPVDDGYNYHETYPEHWDKKLKETENALQEMEGEHQYILHEYDSYDDLDPHVAQLEAKLKSAIAPLSQKYYGIHFVGLDQGGNIAADVAQKIKSSLGEDGSIDSIFCVGTALSGNEEKIKFLSSVPNVANYKSCFDLSANAILYSKEPEKIIETIKLVNQTPVKYMYNMLVIKITKILTQLLNGLNLGTSTGLAPLEHLVSSLRSDVGSIVSELFQFVKHLIGSFKAFLKLPDLDQKFDEVFSDPGAVAAASAERLMQFLKSFKDLFQSSDGVGLDSERLNFGKAFNFLVPPVLLINDALNALTVKLDDNEPANELREFTDKDKYNAPITKFDKQLATKDPYQKVILESAQKQDPDQLTSLIATVQQGVETLAHPGTDGNKRTETGIALSRSLMLPMLSSKTELLALLMKKLPSLGNNPALSKIQSDTVTAPLLGILRKIKSDTDFDNTDNGNEKELGLKKALERLDGSIGKIKGIFQPNYFKIDKKYNSLHFIYNSHNIALAEMPKELRLALDKATNIYQTKLAKGFEYDDLDGTYKPGKGGVKTEEVLIVEVAKEPT